MFNDQFYLSLASLSTSSELETLAIVCFVVIYSLDRIAAGVCRRMVNLLCSIALDECENPAGEVNGDVWCILHFHFA